MEKYSFSIRFPMPRRFPPCAGSYACIIFNQMVKPYSSPRGKSRNAPATARKKTAESGKAKARPRKAPSGDAEKRILEAARKEFIAKGLDGARMQAVAASAGVNKALLHYYFRSKEKLYARVLEEILGAVWGELAGEFRARSPEAGLEP